MYMQTILLLKLIYTISGHRTEEPKTVAQAGGVIHRVLRSLCDKQPDPNRELTILFQNRYFVFWDCIRKLYDPLDQTWFAEFLFKNPNSLSGTNDQWRQ